MGITYFFKPFTLFLMLLIITEVNGPITSRPITSTKMPDFRKIHQKKFDQMDSLHDYLKKKDDRIKRLFGTPQPGTLKKCSANNR